MPQSDKVKSSPVAQQHRHDTAAYIRDLADELAKQARKDQLTLLAFLLEMARHEAERCEQSDAMVGQH